VREHPTDPAWIDELAELLRIPSVSADPDRAADVVAAAEWVADFVRRAGGEAKLVPTSGGRPLVVGELPASVDAATAPTVLVYGHVDVQPAGDLALWDSDPFEPTVRDGWLYARGSADDKGNLFMQLEAAAQLARHRALPVNVRVVCDAEEEVGGDSIVAFLEADARGADACTIFDGAMARVDVPVFNIGVRGLVYYHLTLRSGERDMHSGVFGGAALNAAHAIADVLRAVTAMPEELRAGAVPPTEAELASWDELDPGAEVLAVQGASPCDASAAREFYRRTFALPAVDVHGISVGEPFLTKTVLPVEASANVSIRLAAGQRAGEVAAAFERLLRDATPPGAVLDLERRSASDAALVPPDTPALALASDAFERALGRRPLLVRSGGTLPIVPALAAKGIPTILTGFDVPEGNVHAPNERLLVRYLGAGIAAARELLTALAELR
jgi:acetylornithine deacetylase/succinyl-diaminopimelate desuccinylase-like protein